jgi:hypothetical protein
MAWCENCKKTGFRKEDVELDDSLRKILCHGCYALAHPGWMPPHEFVDVTETVSEVLPKLDYAVSFDSKDGLKAQVSYGELALRVHAPMEQIKKYLGPA